MVDENKLHQFIGQMLGDLGGAASISMVRIGDSASRSRSSSRPPKFDVSTRPTRRLPSSIWCEKKSSSEEYLVLISTLIRLNSSPP